MNAPTTPAMMSRRSPKPASTITSASQPAIAPTTSQRRNVSAVILSRRCNNLARQRRDGAHELLQRPRAEPVLASHVDVARDHEARLVADLREVLVEVR